MLIFNPSIQQVEAEESQAESQFGAHSKTVSKKEVCLYKKPDQGYTGQMEVNKQINNNWVKLNNLTQKFTKVLTRLSHC